LQTKLYSFFFSESLKDIIQAPPYTTCILIKIDEGDGDDDQIQDLTEDGIKTHGFLSSINNTRSRETNR